MEDHTIIYCKPIANKLSGRVEFYNYVIYQTNGILYLDKFCGDGSMNSNSERNFVASDPSGWRINLRVNSKSLYSFTR